MKVKPPVALISDFDGTISKEDFFWFLIDKFLTHDDLKPWDDYKSGKITHITALGQIFGKVHIEVNEFDRFVLTLPIEEAFVETVNTCKAKGIEFHILSAGADYYINYWINHLNLNGLVSINSNKSYYTKETGLAYHEFDNGFDTKDPFYSREYGISKFNFVKHYKDRGYFCIFAGDGTPDFECAKLADVVFARKVLLKKCLDAGIKTEKFESYEDILDFIKSLEIEGSAN